jgi:leucyl/phenylalanyl-tRNA--protein transferase
MRRRGPVWLGSRIEFPLPESAGPGGLLAVGGDLSPERLLAAYRRGIFPWPWAETGPMLWWCPDPRFVLYPDGLRVSRSLEQRIRSRRFNVRLDTAFAEVVEGCAATPRRDSGAETWITAEMRDAYVRLHALGHAHSAEAWRDGRLVGGLYGVALGGVFFGESMFHKETDASKVAFACLVRQLARWGFRLVDCQLETPHLASLGARAVPRKRFLAELAGLLALPNRRGPWRFDPS